MLLLTCLAAPAPLAASDTPLAKGVFLVATDHLHGTSFAKTVILITQLDAHGAMGLALNRPSQRLVKEFFPDIHNAAGAAELYLGGPVHPLALFVLSRPNPGKDWIPVLDDIAFSGGAIARRSLTQAQTDAPNTMTRAYAGYTGWAPGQLPAEIQRGDWRVIPGNPQLIFSAQPDALWEKLSKIPTEHWI